VKPLLNRFLQKHFLNTQTPTLAVFPNSRSHFHSDFWFFFKVKTPRPFGVGVLATIDKKPKITNNFAISSFCICVVLYFKLKILQLDICNNKKLKTYFSANNQKNLISTKISCKFVFE